MNGKLIEKIEAINKGKIPEGYKKTEFGILPSDWKHTCFNRIFEEVSDRTSDTDKYPLYSLTIEDGIVPKTERYERSFLVKNQEDTYKIVRKNEFVYNPMNLRFGALARLKEDKEVSVSGYYNIFRVISDHTPEFFDSFLKSERMIHYYNTVATGSLKEKQRVHFSQFMGFQIPMPSVNESIKIASIICTWDKAIALKENLIELKRKQKKVLMKSLFTEKVRIPGFNKKWTESTLGNLFDRVTRKNSEGNTNVLTISAQQGLINQNDFFSKSVASETLDNYFLLEKGEFAYNKSYSNGYPMGAIKRLTKYEKGVVTTLYICFKLKEELDFSPEFFEQYFEAGLLNRGLTKVANEGGRAHGLLNVTPFDFFNLKVTIPDGQEQKVIADVLVNAEKEIQLLEKELDQLKQQKKGLMQLLLTGKVRVKC